MFNPLTFRQFYNRSCKMRGTRVHLILAFFFFFLLSSFGFFVLLSSASASASLPPLHRRLPLSTTTVRIWDSSESIYIRVHVEIDMEMRWIRRLWFSFGMNWEERRWWDEKRRRRRNSPKQIPFQTPYLSSIFSLLKLSFKIIMKLHTIAIY